MFLDITHGSKCNNT
ncbi:MAG: hypothetical protein EPO11_07695 [Gammaproteobacteria bacterium]|nr:MAG: hypothetical protein EPO11_07695 [Gammaproteobacteria bacterium]